MDAASLKKVTSNLSLGTNALPSAGGTSGVISRGTVGSGPMPTPAINSGKKLDSALLAASHNRSNGQGRLYDGFADFDEDDQPLSTAGNGSKGVRPTNESK
jgi:hypothetical protein